MTVAQTVTGFRKYLAVIKFLNKYKYSLAVGYIAKHAVKSVSISQKASTDLFKSTKIVTEASFFKTMITCLAALSGDARGSEEQKYLSTSRKYRVIRL